MEPTLPKDHEDHIAEKGYNSISHYNLVHTFTPLSQAMKMADATGRRGQGIWKKLETLPAWQEDKMKSKKEVILEAQRE